MSAVPQIDAEPSCCVVNLHRFEPGHDEKPLIYSPRTLPEHEHETTQIGILLRRSVVELYTRRDGGAAFRTLVGGQSFLLPRWSRTPYVSSARRA